jgi:enamidase
VVKTAIVNIGHIVSGDWREPVVAGDAILIEGDRLARVGQLEQADLEDCELVIDAKGVTACPGFIDSHVHVAFGDYAPRFASTGFLKDYLYGGTTTAISASEVHVPGRPSDIAGVKALAIAARKCWDNYRPGGMRVHGGNVILEPGMTEDDFNELASHGIWLAKAGFGNVATPFDYVPLMRAARKAGMITNVHTGGASLSLANSIYGEHVVAMQPDVAFHINGGPVAIPDDDFELIVTQSDCALQVCQAGNLRAALKTLALVTEHDCFDRFLIGTDTPTGIGVMPEGMIKSIVEMASLSDHGPEKMIAAATGNVARRYRLNSGFLRPGCDADLLLMDAPFGAAKSTAMECIKNGDVTAGVACITAGVVRYIGRSRCTPPPARIPEVTRNRLPIAFDPPAMLH